MLCVHGLATEMAKSLFLYHFVVHLQFFKLYSHFICCHCFFGCTFCTYHYQSKVAESTTYNGSVDYYESVVIIKVSYIFVASHLYLLVFVSSAITYILRNRSITNGYHFQTMDNQSILPNACDNAYNLPGYETKNKL